MTANRIVCSNPSQLRFAIIGADRLHVIILTSVTEYQAPSLPLSLVNSCRLDSILHLVPNPCLMALAAIHIRTTPILFDIVGAVLSGTLLRHAP